MDNEQIETKLQDQEQPISQDIENFEIPEGTEVIGEKVICSKHGDVTGSLTKYQYLKVDEDKDHKKVIQPYNIVFCTQCICDMLFELQDQGKIGTLTREKQVATHENAAKIRAYYAEKLAKLQEQEKRLTSEAKATEEKQDENKAE